MSDLLNALNEEQRLAVENIDGYVRLHAGAGTGKTRTLTYRYAYLVSELGIPAKSVWCCTFTNKAASEMKSRILSLCGDVGEPFVSTFHSFCVSFLKEEIMAIGWPKNFTIWDVNSVKAALRPIYDECHIDGREFPLKKAWEFIDGFKEEREYITSFIDADSTKLLTRSDRASDLGGKVFWRYLFAQRTSYALDFDDLILLTLYILKNFPQVRERWQERLEYIMVDEFQDIDRDQYELVEILAGKHHNLFIVGDPDQTIYSWRGARVEYFNDFIVNHGGKVQEYNPLAVEAAALGLQTEDKTLDTFTQSEGQTSALGILADKVPALGLQQPDNFMQQLSSRAAGVNSLDPIDAQYATSAKASNYVEAVQYSHVLQTAGESASPSSKFAQQKKDIIDSRARAAIAGIQLSQNVQSFRGPQLSRDEQKFAYYGFATYQRERLAQEQQFASYHSYADDVDIPEFNQLQDGDGQHESNGLNKSQSASGHTYKEWTAQQRQASGQNTESSEFVEHKRLAQDGDKQNLNYVSAWRERLIQDESYKLAAKVKDAHVSCNLQEDLQSAAHSNLQVVLHDAAHIRWQGKSQKTSHCLSQSARHKHVDYQAQYQSQYQNQVLSQQEQASQYQTSSSYQQSQYQNKTSHQQYKMQHLSQPQMQHDIHDYDTKAEDAVFSNTVNTIDTVLSDSKNESSQSESHKQRTSGFVDPWDRAHLQDIGRKVSPLMLQSQVMAGRHSHTIYVDSDSTSATDANISGWEPSSLQRVLYSRSPSFAEPQSKVDSQIDTARLSIEQNVNVAMSSAEKLGRGDALDETMQQSATQAVKFSATYAEQHFEKQSVARNAQAALHDLKLTLKNKALKARLNSEQDGARATKHNEELRTNQAKWQDRKHYEEQSAVQSESQSLDQAKVKSSDVGSELKYKLADVPEKDVALSYLADSKITSQPDSEQSLEDKDLHFEMQNLDNEERVETGVSIVEYKQQLTKPTRDNHPAYVAQTSVQLTDIERGDMPLHEDIPLDVLLQSGPPVDVGGFDYQNDYVVQSLPSELTAEKFADREWAHESKGALAAPTIERTETNDVISYESATDEFVVNNTKLKRKAKVRISGKRNTADEINSTNERTKTDKLNLAGEHSSTSEHNTKSKRKIADEGNTEALSNVASTAKSTYGVTVAQNELSLQEAQALPAFQTSYAFTVDMAALALHAATQGTIHGRIFSVKNGTAIHAHGAVSRVSKLAVVSTPHAQADETESQSLQVKPQTLHKTESGAKTYEPQSSNYTGSFAAFSTLLLTSETEMTSDSSSEMHSWFMQKIKSTQDK